MDIVTTASPGTVNLQDVLWWTVNMDVGPWHISVRSCKMDDHETVCISKIVPCINVIYGCEELLPRHKMSVPSSSSVVVCKFAWERVDRNITSKGHRSSQRADELADECFEKLILGEKFVEDFFHSDTERITKLKRIAKENLEAEENSKNSV